MATQRARTEPSWDLVLKRNCIERLKQEKSPEEILQELPRLISCGYEAIPEEDIVRMHWWGIFHDKPKIGNFCMRIKSPSGILKPYQLRGIGELSVEFGQNYVELTTRQNVQLHWLRLPILPRVFDRVQELGLTTKGGCGDTVRNITGCPVAGLNPEELFDPTPLLLQVSRFFDEIPEYSNLPRKHKITISACPNWCTAPEIHDQALIATQKDGRHGFALWIGGGLASTPRLARPLGVFIEPDDVIPVLRAVIDEWSSQTRYRVSRVKARIKFMMDDYGPEGFRELIEARLGRKLEDLPEEPRPCGSANHMGIHRQKQPGLYFIGFPVPAGRMTGEQLIAIADILDRFGGDFRITRQQNFILTGVPEWEILRVLDEMKALGYTPTLSPLWGNGVACTGNPHCNYALCDAKGTLEHLIRHLEEVFGRDTVQDLDLSLHVDGCPHACAHHWVGDIGLQGTTLRLRGGDGRTIEAYEIYLRGGLGHHAAIGRPIIRRVPAEQVHLYVERLIRAYLSGRKNGESIQEFFNRHSDEELIAIGAGEMVPSSIS
ncbi:MAG TPA: nitrite/sulfite reductase [Caldilineae bacterium]|nr:nitrite/sulfite reductase [Caldilineae bacterium]